jgi:hypothetical protein
MGARKKKSRKRSATRGGQPPETITFFVDRSLGRQVAEALRGAGADVEIHDAHFAEDTSDVDWIAEVGRRRWVVLTKDKGIRRKRLERRAVEAASLRLFTLGSGSMTSEQMADIFIAHRSRIERLAQQRPAPFIAVVTATEVRVVVDFTEDEAAEEEATEG